MYKGVIAFIILQLIALGIVGYYPQLVNYLPKRLQLTAETAPPPRNPSLQHCVEQFVTGEFNTNNSQLQAAIDNARSLDYSILPKKLAKSVSGSFEQAEQDFGLLAQANESAVVIDEASGDFRPMHEVVRDIRTGANQYQREIDELSKELRRLPDDADANTRTKLENHIEELKQAITDIEATTPDNWTQARADFTELQQTERNLRRDFRKAADKGYSPIAQLQATLASTPALKEMEGEIQILIDHVGNNEPADSVDILTDASKQFGNIEGAKDIKSHISKARKAVKSKKPSVEKALEALAKAQEEYDNQMQWRSQAEATLAAPIAEYEAAIRDTIGIRQQQKLTKDQALYVAACNAGHRDISLNF